MAGDLQLLKTFLANGFVVIVEKGFEGAGFNGWMGHYEVISGYDDATQQFTAQDSYIMPNLPVSYADMEQYWRHFNYTYIVIYPPEREQEVMDILGSDADETYNFTHAAEQASQDILTFTDRKLFFAWYNRGTSLMWLRDYAGAAAAYDEAFRIDASLATTDPDNRPYRIIWYQTGPYFAYFYTGRYYDVINLADTTLFAMSEPVLEESYYWRALAKEALGDIDGAIADLRMALNVHPNWSIALTELERMGATP
jgi:tetratricopeptide (TPR) repeat protein